MDRDEKHLQILSIFHYILGGFTVSVGILSVISDLAGIHLIADPGRSLSLWEKFYNPGWTVLFILTWALALCIVLAGYYLSKRRHYFFCVGVAIFEMIYLCPCGIVLGIFSLIVLMCPSVKQLFANRTVPSCGPREQSCRGLEVLLEMRNVEEMTLAYQKAGV